MQGDAALLQRAIGRVEINGGEMPGDGALPRQDRSRALRRSCSSLSGLMRSLSSNSSDTWPLIAGFRDSPYPHYQIGPP
jgi:hypothetical protein